ncbi:Poly [ADP-ribose] polymerase [Aphelenchoides besseyi]|nr:Poly [ADP-ribose] polymerase [Aphelenchoides besseyi]
MHLDLNANPDDPILQLFQDIEATDSHASGVYRSLKVADDEDKFRIDKGNCRLCFHGTIKPNVYKILRDGFRWKVSKEEGNFGQGIYFSDCVTKAANYTSSDPRRFSKGADVGFVDPPYNETMYLFLSEVALGDVIHFNCLPAYKSDLLRGHESVHAIGRHTYRLKDWTFQHFPGLDFTTLVPQGTLEPVNECTLAYDEFVIYKTCQARHRYLLNDANELEFTDLPIKMRTWSIYFFFCVLACCAILLSESTKKFKGKRSRAAKTPASTACNPDNTCANPKHVCQTSDGNCYPKNTPGLNDHDDCKDVHPPRRRSQCPGIRYLCNNTIYYTLMTSQSCLPDSTCKDPNDVCQKSDGNCFPKGTPGLNDSDNSSSSTDSDDSDDSDDSSQKKKKKRRGDGSNRPECCDRVNPLTGISECRAKRNLCNMGRFFNLMTQECARTCRRQSKCGTNPRIRSQRICTTPRPNCSDTINGQRFNRCTRIRASNNCRSRRLFNFIRINCRQTCKFC